MEEWVISIGTTIGTLNMGLSKGSIPPVPTQNQGIGSQCHGTPSPVEAWWVLGLGFRILGFGFWGLGFRILGFRILGLGCRV